MGEGQRRGGGSTWGCVIEGGAPVLLRPMWWVVLHQGVRGASLTWRWGSGSCGVAQRQRRRVLMVATGENCLWGRRGGAYIGEGVHVGGELWRAVVAKRDLGIILEFITILDSFGFLGINPLLWFPWTLFSEVLWFLAPGGKSKGAWVDGVWGTHENGIELSGGRPIAHWSSGRGAGSDVLDRTTGRCRAGAGAGPTWASHRWERSRPTWASGKEFGPWPIKTRKSIFNFQIFSKFQTNLNSNQIWISTTSTHTIKYKST
jgi:hypothetical protein